MSDAKMRLQEHVMTVYGDQIAAYARGSDTLEQVAVSVLIPAIAALTMPEEYAAIVLTSRMDNELRKLLERALHRQGDAEQLLFEVNTPFATFSAKAAAAFRMLTWMTAFTACSWIRPAKSRRRAPAR